MPDTARLLVDCAGAAMGGAKSYLDELDRHLEASGDPVAVVGRGRQLSRGWLLRRERQARLEGATGVIALNNVSFVGPGIQRTVLLRNALHFLSTAEAATIPEETVRAVRRQIGVVHLALRRADRAIVPSVAMYERVVARCPFIEPRLEVLHHPLTAIDGQRERPDHPVILCPVLLAPYKQMGRHLEELVDAAERVAAAQGEPVDVWVTATPAELAAAGVASSARLRPLGRLQPAELADHLLRATAVVFPTAIESFGYPLAEGRVNRVPVIARDLPLTREIAGDALVPYEPGAPDSLTRALHQAIDLELPPLASNPFDPAEYFSRLFSTEPARPAMAATP